ncbi:unnamed protein product, partial [Didymodactylos carnosus]
MRVLLYLNFGSVITTENEHPLQIQDSTSEEDEPRQQIDFQPMESKATGGVKVRVYLDYFRAGSGLFLGIFLVFVVFSLQQATAVFSNWWLARWSDAERFRHSTASLNCTFTKADPKIRTMSDAEWELYRNRRFHIYCGVMFQRIIHCPIYFFDNIPVGRILSRFTKDVAIMDELLPISLFDFLQ